MSVGVIKIVADVLSVATQFGVAWADLVPVLKDNGMNEEMIATYESAIADRRTFKDFHSAKAGGGE